MPLALRLALPLVLACGLAQAGPPDLGVDARRERRLSAALGRCGPGDELQTCLAELTRERIDFTVDEGRVMVGLSGAFFAVVLDLRGGTKIVDAVFRGVGMPSEMRGEVASFLERSAGAYPFSEDCAEGAAFCGVLYPKQAEAGGAIEIGFGLLQVAGRPAWRKPAPASVDGKPVYGKRDRLLDVRRTGAAAVAVQFSLPLGRDGRPTGSAPLLRHAWDVFVGAPFVRLP